MRKNIFVKLLIVTVLVSSLTTLVSCVHVHHRTAVQSKPLPPGQAKKIYGDKSAKNYTKKRR